MWAKVAKAAKSFLWPPRALERSILLAKRAASLSAKLEMKRQLLKESTLESSSIANEPRERVLFVLEQPAALPATEAAETAPAK